MRPSFSPLTAICLFIILAFPLQAQDRLSEFYYAGDYTRVIEESAGLLDQGDSSLAIFRVKALAEIQLGRTAEAVATLEAAAGTHPDDPGLQRMLAGQYFEAGNFIRAKDTYSELVAQDSSDISSWMKLAEMAAFRQQYPEAIDALNRVLALDTMNLESLMKMGEILDRFNNTGSVVFYRRAWSYYPDNQKAAYAYANELVRQKKSVEAIPVCDSMLSRDSTSIKFLKLKAYAHYKCGEAFPAIICFNSACSQGDSSVFTFKYRGICQFLVSDFSGSISSLELAAVKDSTDAEIRFFLGSSLATTTRKEEAMQHLDRSLKLMQPDPSVVGRIHAEQGNIKRLQSDYDRALEYYEMAWEADSTNPMYLYFQASILDNSMHRSGEALVLYRQYAEQVSSPDGEKRNGQTVSILTIVMDRIEMLQEELFFRDED